MSVLSVFDYVLCWSIVCKQGNNTVKFCQGKVLIIEVYNHYEMQSYIILHSTDHEL